ncbi:MAG: hypothetical protein AB1432_03275 [Bacteroidota bacterium]
MKKIADRIAATVAIVFSGLSLAEGSQVLLRLSIPDYIVFTPLLIYNVIMGVVGIYVGVQIFRRQKNSLKYSTIVALFHISTLVTVSLLYFISSAVSTHSVNAMILRSSLWLIVTISVLLSKRNFTELKEKL